MHRLPCWFCNRPFANAAFIVSCDKPPLRQFRDFNIDAHEECYQRFLRTGDLQLKKGFDDGHSTTTK